LWTINANINIQLSMPNPRRTRNARPARYMGLTYAYAV
jgi:hypothetical protein